MKKTIATEAFEDAIKEVYGDTIAAYSFPVGKQYAVLTYEFVEHDIYDYSKGCDVVDTEMHANVFIAIGDTEDDAINNTLTLFSDEEYECVSTGTQGMKGMYMILKNMLWMEDVLRASGIKSISACPADEKRERAYKRLCRYGYEEVYCSGSNELLCYTKVL